MSTRIDRPSLDAAAGSLTRRARVLERTPGQWIYVGDEDVPEAPAFQNGWANSGSGFVPMRFKIDKTREVVVEGAVEGGSGTIFTLPLAYRPDFSIRFSCPDGLDVQVDPNGDVTPIP